MLIHFASRTQPTFHNVLARVPIENVLVMYEIVRELGGYPLR